MKVGYSMKVVPLMNVGSSTNVEPLMKVGYSMKVVPSINEVKKSTGVANRPSIGFYDRIYFVSISCLFTFILALSTYLFYACANFKPRLKFFKSMQN